MIDFERIVYGATMDDLACCTKSSTEELAFCISRKDDSSSVYSLGNKNKHRISLLLSLNDPSGSDLPCDIKC